MKSFGLLFLVGIFFSTYLGCKKADKPVPVNPVKADTLSAGWTKNSSITTLLSDIYFKNNIVGYAVGNAIYKTIDGGTTWVKALDKSCENIAVVNDNIAFFARYDSVYKTVDGGATIQGIKVGAGQNRDIFFTNANTGICSTTSGIYVTNNGGDSWQLINSTTPITDYYPSIFMLNNTNAWIVYNRSVLHSNGDLSHWTTDPLSGSPATLISVYATSASVLYAGTAQGGLYRSVNGGANLTLIKNFSFFSNSSSGGYLDIHFVDANTGYVSYGNRIYKTTDAGSTWSVIAALGNTDFVEIHFTDAGHGWACCTDGSILKFN